MTNEMTLYEVTAETINPIYDGRATVGLRSKKTFESGTKFVLRRNARSTAFVSIAILWDTTVHTVSATDENASAFKLVEAFDLASMAVKPETFDEYMMTLDHYWDGMGVCPSVGEIALDSLIRSGAIDSVTILAMLRAALEEGQN